MKKDKRLIIVGGPNGSGKTTFAKQYAKEHGIEYLGADEIVDAIRCKNTDRAALLIHTLKSVAGGISANDLVCVAQRLEQKVKTNDQSNIDNLINELKAMNTSTLFLMGEGEPLLHDRIFDILQEIKKVVKLD